MNLFLLGLPSVSPMVSSPAAAAAAETPRLVILATLVFSFTFSCSVGQPSGSEFRVFPYENPALEPFETAVAALNPQVAVKVRSAAVHAALADV
jgi:hypothetical protein